MTSAWAAPTIVVASAAPAAAAFSGGALTNGGLSFSTAAFDATVPPWYNWDGMVYEGPQTTTPTGSTNGAAVLTISLSTVTVSGTGSEPVRVTITITGQQASGSTRGASMYGAVSSGWTLVGTPTFAAYSGMQPNAVRTAQFVFDTVLPVSAPGSTPPLSFKVVTASGSAANVYPWTSGKTVTVASTATGATGDSDSATT